MLKLLDLTLDTPAENLALDEALLDAAEASDQPSEVLRIWESPQPMVILGRSSRVADEVDARPCQQLGIPVLRRCSGGAAVVAGPGCLMYAVVLSHASWPPVRMITEAHRLILGVLVQTLRPLVPGVGTSGTSDLTVDGKKVSGNSLRCRRTHLLYHGTLLYDFQLGLISRCLRLPPRQPDYREGRSHEAFLNNFGIRAADLRTALIRGWEAGDWCLAWPEAATRQLVAAKYGQKSWNYCL